MSSANAAQEKPSAADRGGWLQEQFCMPRGLLGKLVGWWMARDNEAMNRFAIDTARVSARDSVLEIGFGPGRAIELLVKRTAAPLVAGIDPSEPMVAEARQVNHEAISAGRVDLRQGVAEKLPWPAGQFSRVLAISNFQIWDDQAAGLNEVRRVLRPGGQLIICLRRALKRPGWLAAPGATGQELEKHLALLRQHGFVNVRLRQRKPRRRLVCIIGERAPL